MNKLVQLTALSGLFLASLATHAGTVNVTQPDGVNDRIAEGRDYATYEKGNRWDMSDTADIQLTESRNVSNESFSGGIYRGTAANNDPNIWLVFPGVPSAINSLETGQIAPIDTSVYRFLTMKIRITGTPDTQQMFIYYYESEASLGPSIFGLSNAIQVPTNAWQIVTIDLATQSFTGGEGMSDHTWNQIPFARGLRIDPTGTAGLTFELDWVRLTSAPVDTSTSYTVAYGGNSGNVDIDAVDPSGDAFRLATGVAGGSTSVDMSKLWPLDWTIRVTDNIGSANSPGPVMINDAPQLNFTNPDIMGDVANSYAQIEAGNPWGPMDAGDVDPANPYNDLINISFTNPAGSLSAVPTGSDSSVLLNAPIAIDTQKYRMVTYTIEVTGDRNIGLGSVARVLWGNNLTSLNTSDDVVVQEGTNSYSLGDMRNVPLEGGATNQWIGSIDFFRLDPHEFPCPCGPARDIRIDSVILAPLDSANPTLMITWDDFDPDDNATISLFADEDRIPGNGNDVMIATGIAENAASSFSWNGPADVADGEYEIYAIIDDGFNQMTRYATGAVSVGGGATVDISVVQPDGVNDNVTVGSDYSREVRGNDWNMGDSADVLEERSVNLASETTAGGIYSATATTADPQFWLLFPNTGSEGDVLNGNVFPIDTSTYRYVTLRIRYTGAGTHIPQVFFFEDEFLTSSRFGFASSNKAYSAGEWITQTIDMVNDLGGASANTWTGISQVRGLRIDPTSVSGTAFEIDWVTLTGPATSDSDFLIQWTADDLGAATIQLTTIDSNAVRIPIVDGLPPLTTQHVANFARLPTGQYNIEVAAIPGPLSVSTGPLSIVVGSAPDPGLVFKDGFE